MAGGGAAPAARSGVRPRHHAEPCRRSTASTRSGSRSTSATSPPTTRSSPRGCRTSGSSTRSNGPPCARAGPAPAHRITVTYGASKDRDHASHHRRRPRRQPRRPATTTRPAPSTCWWATCPTACSTVPRCPGRARRGPERLLAEALPVWRDVLRPGGGLALAWNRRTLPRPRLVELATDAGPRRSPTPDDDALRAPRRPIDHPRRAGRLPAVRLGVRFVRIVPMRAIGNGPSRPGPCHSRHVHSPRREGGSHPWPSS